MKRTEFLSFTFNRTYHYFIFICSNNTDNNSKEKKPWTPTNIKKWRTDKNKQKTEKLRKVVAAMDVVAREETAKREMKSNVVAFICSASFSISS